MTQRPKIFPAEWLASSPTYIDNRVASLLDDAAPMPSAELERLKVMAAGSYVPPFTLEEIKLVYPGIYFPVEH